MNITTYASSKVPSGIYTSGVATNTNLIDGMTNALNSYYGIYKNVAISEYRFGSYLTDSFVLPGMANTNVKGISCDNMVPQGIEVARGYIFITAYCKDEEHNSVIYVLDSLTKEYITTLVMPHKAHSGGIAYANYCLWVCGGSSNGKGQLYYYNYSEIRDAIQYAEA